MRDTSVRNAMREASNGSLSGSGRPGIWAVSGLALFLALAGPTLVFALQGGAQLRWYDAYDRGIAAVKEENWQLAEQLLLQARKNGPPQAARQLFFGDNYRPFVPDYYLGIVYLRTNRPEEADKAFGAASVIAGREREFASIPALRAEAVKLAAAKSAPQPPPGPPSNLNTEPAVQTAAPAAQTPAAQAQVGQTTAPAASTNPPAPDDSGTPRQAAVPPPSPVSPITVPPRTPPRDPGSAGTSASRGTGGTSPYNPTQPGMAPKDVFARWRQGLRSFLVGDYGGAVATLEQVVNQPGAPPEARVYLACARVGAVLTGRGDAALLAAARQEFQAIDGLQALDADDRRYISPRILAQLQAR